MRRKRLAASSRSTRLRRSVCVKRGGGGVRPLAPTAQGSEQLPSAGKFAEGTATEAPKSIAIVRDLQKVLHEVLEGVKLAEGRIPKRGIFARALAVVDPRAQVVRSVSLSDVPAIGHEYGHLMQKLLFGATAKGGIDNAQLASLPGAVRGELEDLAKGISDESLRSRTASPTPSKHPGAYDRSGDYGRCSLPIQVTPGAMTRRIADVVTELGLQPWKPPDPLDPIEEEEVNLVVWMGVMNPDTPTTSNVGNTAVRR